MGVPKFIIKKSKIKGKTWYSSSEFNFFLSKELDSVNTKMKRLINIIIKSAFKL